MFFWTIKMGEENHPVVAVISSSNERWGITWHYQKDNEDGVDYRTSKLQMQDG